MWEPSFIAVTVLLGDTVDDALAALGATDEAGAVDAGRRRRIAALVAKLRAPARATRATALAEVGRDVALAVERGRWR